MVAHGGALGSLLLVLPLVGLLVVEVLPGVGVDAQERALEQEDLAVEDAALEVDQPLGVERLPVVAGLEVQVGSGGTPGGAAQAMMSPASTHWLGSTSRSERWP